MIKVEGKENIARLHGEEVLFKYYKWGECIKARVIAGEHRVTCCNGATITTYPNQVHVIYSERGEDGAVWCNEVDSSRCSVYLMALNKGER